MIEITPTIAIDEQEIQLDFVRSSGPGGQNVNKVASAVQLRFNIEQADLPAGVRRRLARLAGKRLTRDGTLIIEAKQHREQERNRQEAINRLVDLLRQAAQPPKPRRKTKPTASSKKRRLEAKRRRGQKKRLRRPVDPSEL